MLTVYKCYTGNNKFSMRLRNKGAEHRHMPFCALDFSEKMPDNSTTDYDDNIGKYT